MIATLLRRDAVLRATPWAALAAVAMVVILSVTLLDSVTRLDRSIDSATQETELTTWVELLVHLQALALALAITLSVARRVDDIGPFSVARPLDLCLPVSPRAAWLVRLLSLAVAVLVTVGTTALTLSALSSDPTPLDLAPAARLAALAGSIALGGLASVGRDGRRGWAGYLAVALVCGAAALAFAADLGAFRPDDAGPVTHFGPWGPALLLMLLGVAALRWWNLPSSWSLPSAARATTRVGQAPTPEALPGAASLPAGTTTGATASDWAPGAARGRWWRVVTSSVWDWRVLFFALTALALPLMQVAEARPWVLVVFASWPLVLGSQYLLTRLAYLDVLPVSRARLLAAGLLPMVAALVLAGLAGLAWESWRHPLRPVVTLDDEVLELGDDEAARVGHRYASWVEVDVPPRLWRWAPAGEVPEQRGPQGIVQPRPVPVLGGLFTVYNPYDAPPDTSPELVAWQFARALEAEHGVWIEPSELAERYLALDPWGQVDIAPSQVAHNNESHEQLDGPWYGSLGTLAIDYPQLAPRLDPRRPALGVLAVALVAGLAGAWLLRVRPGSLASKVAVTVFGPLLMMSYALDLWLGTWLGDGHPQVLFSLLGQALLDLTPGGVVGLWLVALAGVAAGFALLARAFGRAESVAFAFGPHDKRGR